MKHDTDVTKVDFNFEEHDVPPNKSMWSMRMIPHCFFLECHMPQSIVDDFNSYLDDLHRTTYQYSLIGAIKRGEQLIVDPNHPKVLPWTLQMLELCSIFLKQFEGATGNVLSVKREARINSFWSVHSYEGDYNPCHDHGTIDVTGLSFAGWTRLPKSIVESVGDQGGVTTGTQDNHDGYFQFITTSSAQRDMFNFRPQTNPIFKPKVGKFLIFPAWLNHCVWPFFGPGERRSIAGNLSFEQLSDKEAEESFKKNYPEMYEIKKKAKEKEKEAQKDLTVKSEFAKSKI